MIMGENKSREKAKKREGVTATEALESDAPYCRPATPRLQMPVISIFTNLDSTTPLHIRTDTPLPVVARPPAHIAIAKSYFQLN